jgi:hypothetical protein
MLPICVCSDQRSPGGSTNARLRGYDLELQLQFELLTPPLGRSIQMEEQLIEEISDGVATLTFNLPDRLNALSTPIMEGLIEALPRLARDAAVGVIVPAWWGASSSRALRRCSPSVMRATYWASPFCQVSRYGGRSPSPMFHIIGPARLLAQRLLSSARRLLMERYRRSS